MFEEGFWNRFAKRSTLRQVLRSTDWVISGAVVLVIYLMVGDNIMSYDMNAYITSATSLSRSLIAITITGVAIIVSLTDKDVLATLNRIDIYDSLMIVFELTVLISIITTLYGIFIQTYAYGALEIYVFTFLFSYLVLNVFRLVSDIVTFGEKISQMVMVEELPEDIADIVSKAEEDDTGPTDSSSSSKEDREVESHPD